VIELIALIAIAYAGARGVEKALGIEDRRYDTAAARHTVEKVASSGPKGGTTLVKRPGPTEPGGTFAAAAPRSAKAGRSAAYPLAVVAETGATMWKAIGEGYRQSWPEIRAEHRRKMTERAEARRRKKEEAAAQREAEAVRAKAGPPPAYPPMPTEPPKTEPDIERDAAKKDTDEARKAADPEPAAAKAPEPIDPEPSARRRLSVVPDPAENGDLMSSPSTVIPEIRTLDGLLNALNLTKAMCEMRADEAQAVAADDKALSDRLDQMEAELAELEVDDGTRGEIDALREMVHAQSQAAAQYGATAKDAGDFAAAAAAAAQKSHGGIAEAVQSSPIPVAAQAGYYEH
jgi:hypothetical protein